MNEIDMELNNSFLEELNSTLAIKTDYDSKEYNYTWIEIFEDVIPYIDNILRNPKRFIINEEEVVKVELSKKVTVESIIHLTQHTNYIQDIDDNGDVKPSKILNINKEESLDTYENKFIFTLVKNMTTFFDQHASQISGESYYIDQKLAKYEANTKIGTETVKVSVQYYSLDKNVTIKESSDGSTIEQRLKRMKVQLDGFTGTELYQTLTRLHVSDVRSPIRKTNVILKNPNFQKAVELWNFLQSYDQDDCVAEKTTKEVNDIGDIKSQFDQSFLLDYLAINTLSKKKSEVSEKKAIALALARVIENILETNDEVLEEKIRKVFKDEFKAAKTKVDKRNEKILKTFTDRLNRMNKSIEEACSYLK